MVKCLLAKSCQNAEWPPHAATLLGHTELVCRAATVLLESCAGASLEALGLDPGLAVRLQRVVALAAFVHDLPKANDHFQAMVRGARSAPQLVRHEALAIWLFWPGAPFADWLRPAVVSELDLELAVTAVCGHHRKFPDRAVACEGAGSEITLHLGHSDFLRLLAFGSESLGLGPPPAFEDLPIRAGWREPPEALLQEREQELTARLAEDREAGRILALAKALLIAADVAGSALPRHGGSVDWLPELLVRRAGSEQLMEIVKQRLAGAPMRPFQLQVAGSDAPLTLVRAGCGTGKTVAAYAWASGRHAGRQLWVCYPTTGTSTEGFRDYLAESDVDAQLVHSRAEVDLEMLGLAGEDDPEEPWLRLDALRVWGAPVISCTADTVLGLMQNQRRGIFSWPSLARAALVFDEVHAYDDQMFGTLLRLLHELRRLPVLLMTASLPDVKLKALRSLSRAIHGTELTEIAGPGELESLPRYVLHCEREPPWSEVWKTLRGGGKVLWVVNTVGRCLRAAAAATKRGIHPIVYHSRFVYRDRSARHGEVIEAFRSPGPALAVTTQVAEMSLDLSADLLVSEVAPVPALIQRLGRLNRRVTPTFQRPPCSAFFLPPQAAPPYSEGEIEAAKIWLSSLAGGARSQTDLVAAWRQPDVTGEFDRSSRWLDGGFATIVGDVREASPGITVVLEQHADDLRTGRLSAVAVALPMPKPPVGWTMWPRIQHLPVAPASAIDYDPLRGAQWRNEAQ